MGVKRYIDVKRMLLALAENEDCKVAHPLAAYGSVETTTTTNSTGKILQKVLPHHVDQTLDWLSDNLLLIVTQQEGKLSNITIHKSCKGAVMMLRSSQNLPS